MADRESNQDGPDLVPHLRRAFQHIQEAVRCYAAMLANTAREWGQRTARQVAWGIVLLGLGLIGLVFLLAGLASYVQHLLGDDVPGVGHMCVGALLFVTCGIILWVRRGERGD